MLEGWDKIDWLMLGIGILLTFVVVLMVLFLVDANRERPADRTALIASQETPRAAVASYLDAVAPRIEEPPQGGDRAA
jgi:hypothetical protein